MAKLCSHCDGPLVDGAVFVSADGRRPFCSETCFRCPGTLVTARLRRLLATCATDLLSCPVCFAWTELADGTRDPHHDGCELAAELPS